MVVDELWFHLEVGCDVIGCAFDDDLSQAGTVLGKSTHYPWRRWLKTVVT